MAIHRNIVWDESHTQAYFADITTGTPAAYAPCPKRGELVGFRLAQYAAVTGTSTVITPNVNGTNVTGGTITIPAANAAGAVTSVTLSPGTTVLVNEGDYIGFVSGGQSDDSTVAATVTAIIRNRRN